MADPISTPTPASDNKPKRTRGLINKAWIDEVISTEALVAIVEKDAYRQIMADGGVDAPFLAALKADLEIASGIISQAGQKTVGAKGATRVEEGAKDRLLEIIRIVQARAKQTHAEKNPLVLKDYFVGSTIETSRVVLESSAQSILNKLDSDTLKGLKPAQILELENALAAYKQTQTDQKGKQTGAATERVNLKELVDKIAGQRREIQFAADAEWPSSIKTNRAIRREFDLPGDKPLA